MADENLCATRRSLLAGMALVAGASALPAGGKGEPAMNHVVLLGDSIFDNKAYVGDGPDVVTQLAKTLPAGWTATLNAVDGSTTVTMKEQLDRLPKGATHLVVSTGGNDALGSKSVIEEPARSVGEALGKLARIRAEFDKTYLALLDALLAKKLPTVMCTIYDPRYDNQDEQRVASAGLTIFNDTITHEVFARGLPLIDLKLLFDDARDYANPIEPSVQGGAKLARVIAKIVTTYDFTRPRSEVYVG
jgi:GDSL-like Lipase/Acylhydrolase family